MLVKQSMPESNCLSNLRLNHKNRYQKQETPLSPQPWERLFSSKAHTAVSLSKIGIRSLSWQTWILSFRGTTSSWLRLLKTLILTSLPGCNLAPLLLNSWKTGGDSTGHKETPLTSCLLYRLLKTRICFIQNINHSSDLQLREWATMHVFPDNAPQALLMSTTNCLFNNKLESTKTHLSYTSLLRKKSSQLLAKLERECSPSGILLPPYPQSCSLAGSALLCQPHQSHQWVPSHSLLWKERGTWHRQLPWVQCTEGDKWLKSVWNACWKQNFCLALLSKINFLFSVPNWCAYWKW